MNEGGVQRVYVDVKIDLRDPENAVLIKDAIHQAVISRFKAKLVQTKEEASTLLHIAIKKVEFSPLQYNKSGYVIYYRTYTKLMVVYQKGAQKERFSVYGTYDFPIEPDAVVSDMLRYEAIKKSATKAINQFVSRLSMKNYAYTH